MQRGLPGMEGRDYTGDTGRTRKGVLEPKAGSPKPFSYPQRLQADPVLSFSPELQGDSADEHPSSSSSSSLVPASRRPLSCSSFYLPSPGYSPDLASSPAQVSAAGGEDVILNY